MIDRSVGWLFGSIDWSVRCSGRWLVVVLISHTNRISRSVCRSLLHAVCVGVGFCCPIGGHRLSLIGFAALFFFFFVSGVFTGMLGQHIHCQRSVQHALQVRCYVRGYHCRCCASCCLLMFLLTVVVPWVGPLYIPSQKIGRG